MDKDKQENEHYRRRRYHSVTIYTRPGSKLCELAKRFFDENVLDYVEIDVSRDPVSLDKMVSKTNQNNVPVIEVDGRTVVGYRPEILTLLIN